jgi:hypothetical protein
MVSILGDVIDAELSTWEAKPPVPSTPINNVSKNIIKFREAIGPVLNQSKVNHDRSISFIKAQVGHNFRVLK